MIMESLLFASIFTISIGYPYWKIKHRIFTEPIEPTNQEIRESPEYRKWRLSVLIRDGYRCVWCKATENLEVDHVYPFAYFPDLRFDIKNGRCLCPSCHKLTITYGSNAKKFYQTLKNGN